MGASIRLEYAILDFPTRKIARAARSTLRSETVALSNALGNSLWLQSMLFDMMFRVAPSIRVNSSGGIQLSSLIDRSF